MVPCAKQVLSDLKDVLNDRFNFAYSHICMVWIFSLLVSFPYRTVWYDKKHGLKHTITDTSITTEWDFQSPLTLLKMLSLFIQGENDPKQRNKYIRQYNRLKEDLKEKYDVSNFPDYK